MDKGNETDEYGEDSFDGAGGGLGQGRGPGAAGKSGKKPQVKKKFGGERDGKRKSPLKQVKSDDDSSVLE